MDTYKKIIGQFVDNLKLEGSLEDKTHVISDIEERVQQIIIHTLIANLPETGRKEFLDILDTNPQNIEEKVSTLAETIPGLWNSIQKNIEDELHEIKETFGKQ